MVPKGWHLFDPLPHVTGAFGVSSFASPRGQGGGWCLADLCKGWALGGLGVLRGFTKVQKATRNNFWGLKLEESLFLPARRLEGSLKVKLISPHELLVQTCPNHSSYSLSFETWLFSNHQTELHAPSWWLIVLASNKLIPESSRTNKEILSDSLQKSLRFL